MQSKIVTCTHNVMEKCDRKSIGISLDLILGPDPWILADVFVSIDLETHRKGRMGKFENRTSEQLWNCLLFVV